MFVSNATLGQYLDALLIVLNHAWERYLQCESQRDFRHVGPTIAAGAKTRLSSRMWLFDRCHAARVWLSGFCTSAENY